MSQVATQYNILSDTLRKGIAGFQDSMLANKQLDVEMARLQGIQSDPRNVLAKRQAGDKLAQRDQPFSLEGIATTNTDRMHFAKNILPELDKKFGWKLSEESGQLLAPDGSVVNKEQFGRAGVRLMMKAYSDPKKHIEGNVAHIQGALKSLDPERVPEHRDIYNRLSGELNQNQQLLDNWNPLMVAKNKRDMIYALAEQTPQEGDYGYEKKRADLDYEKAVEDEIRAGRLDADSFSKITLYDKKTGSMRTVLIPSNREWAPLSEGGHEKYDKLVGADGTGRYSTVDPRKKRGGTIKDLTPKEKLSHIRSHYIGLARQISGLDIDDPAKKQEALKYVNRDSALERWRIANSRPTAYELGATIEPLTGHFVGEQVKDPKSDKVYVYVGNRKWHPVQGPYRDMDFRRDTATGAFSEDTVADY